MAFSVVLLVGAVAIRVVNIWDVGGLASRMRARLEARRYYPPIPSWWERVFGIRCFVFGIGQAAVLGNVTLFGSRSRASRDRFDQSMDTVPNRGK